MMRDELGTFAGPGPCLQPMKTFDPTRPARLHEQVNDRIDTWHPISEALRASLASWFDRAETVINCEGLLYDGWEPADG